LIAALRSRPAVVLLQLESIGAIILHHLV